MQVKLLDLQAQYAPLREEIRRAIDQVCDAQAFIGGPALERFEKNLAAYCGTKHAIGVSSGTDAILAALMALDIKAGDEVIVPAFTFFATAGCVSRLGATPVFADIDPRTFNIDPVSIQKKITRCTKAIMPVHLYGQVADMDAINRLAADHGLAVVEDAAQAIGAKRHGKRACSLGRIGCLSFYPTKNLGAFGDAGAICTDDDALAHRCRMIRTHGEEPRYYHKFVGANFRLDALQAAVLDIKLRHLESWHEARRRHAALYDELFAGTPVRAPHVEPCNWSVYNQYVVRLANRDRVREHLAKQNVGSFIYYPLSLHLQECFANLGGKAGDMPQSEAACREVLALPVYPELAQEQVRFVAAEVLKAA
jgi:dTDP-4-amino-4,6-dideoxygalactose transaminase